MQMLQTQIEFALLSCGMRLLRVVYLHVSSAESHKHPLYQLNFQQTKNCLIDFDLKIVLSLIGR